MRKKILFLISLASLFIFGAMISSGASTNWTGATYSIKGAKDTIDMIDSLLASINSQGLKVGSKVTVTKNGYNRKIKFSNNTSGSGYKYLVEVWSEHNSGDGQGLRYQKGLELHFDNANKGFVIVRSAVFNEPNIAADPAHEVMEEGHIMKTIFNHTSDSSKELTIDVIRNKTGMAKASRYKINSTGNKVYIYMTSIMPDDYTANGYNFFNYVYVLGAIIDNAGENNTVVKIGFLSPSVAATALSYNWSYNTAKFNSTVGFVSDGYTGGDTTYPDPTLITTSDLPSQAAVNTVSIAFLGNASVDF